MKTLAENNGKSMVDLVAQNEATKQRIRDVTTRKNQIEDISRQSDLVNMNKTFIDTMAGLTPVIDDQLVLKRESLRLEDQLAQAAITRLITEKPYLAAMEDELRSRQALVAQAKKFNLEMENNKGLQGWAFQKVKTESQKNTWADAMEGAESYITDAFSQGIQGALTKTKLDFMELTKTMAQSFILNIGKQGIHWGFTQIAKGVLGDKAGMFGQRGATPANPLFVSQVGGLGSMPGINGLFGSNLQDEANILLSVFDQGSGLLASNANLFSDIFSYSIEGLNASSESWGGMFGSAISSLLGIFSGGGGGEGGGIFGTVLGIGSSLLGFFLHEGGIVGHGGRPVYAHLGWPPPGPGEVDIRALEGERVLSIPENRAYEAGLQTGGQGKTSAANQISVHAPINVTIHPRQEMTQSDYDRHSRMIVKSLNRELARFGKAPLGPSYG
jgi:hypothetical protein